MNSGKPPMFWIKINSHQNVMKRKKEEGRKKQLKIQSMEVVLQLVDLSRCCLQFTIAWRIMQLYSAQILDCRRIMAETLKGLNQWLATQQVQTEGKTTNRQAVKGVLQY